MCGEYFIFWLFECHFLFHLFFNKFLLLFFVLGVREFLLKAAVFVHLRFFLMFLFFNLVQTALLQKFLCLLNFVLVFVQKVVVALLLQALLLVKLLLKLSFSELLGLTTLVLLQFQLLERFTLLFSLLLQRFVLFELLLLLLGFHSIQFFGQIVFNRNLTRNKFRSQISGVVHSVFQLVQKHSFLIW
ncbi:Hypothetical_protein [Hexamita inflata]|uniref:Hypothetical_protein n=1 Tax=Hexamita inflata TaxID=28002 RepID=A0AA86NVF8_9EUKA|nr:Hypothetical protein HINF_LOCUS13164 [Hexamita inflata]CAI9931754.1 Hypothetical protein HINF_LOCUS19399 [Hexamita inflata]CAI9966239.1 Hypothetical protein HINF_LOCUS53884 [Hexamita inflata]